MPFHSSMTTSRSWRIFETLRTSTFRLRILQRCSIGFKSGDMLGQSITFTSSVKQWLSWKCVWGHCHARTLPSPQLCLGVIRLWYGGCFSSKSTGELQVIHSKMNGSMYWEILEKNLQKSATSLGHSQNFVPQYDNDPKHTANNGISTLNWPSHSPDLNPFENLWNNLKVKIHERNPQNIKQLEELCKEEWGKVTLDQCGKLVGNYRKQLEAMKQKRGYATKY